MSRDARGGLGRGAASRAALIAVGFALGLAFAGSTALQAQQRELRIFTFEGYADDEWVQEFEAAHDADVNVTYTGSVDEMFAKMKGSEGADYDLISIDTSLFGRYIEEGLIVPYDMAEIPNTANLLPAFQDVAEVQHDGDTYGVPITWGSLGLIYDTDEVDPAPTSWAVLWDESYKGRIIILDDTNNNIVNTAIILGYEDPFHLTDEQLEAVKQKLIDQKKVLLSYFAGFEEGNKIWESGNAILMFSMGEFQAVDLANRGYNVAYIIPDEGGVGWLDTWALSKGAKEPELAHAWVNFFLDKSVGERVSQTYGYGTTTSEAEGLDYADKLTWLRPAEDLTKRIEVWNEVKATPVP
jgi:putative spermidine/putrescine transport system substrate-binding protein/spermidine/putrescine transport system substrate-binding protein